MTHPSEPRSPCESASVPGTDPLASRVERLAALRSAFAALAPSALTDEGRAIAERGRALTGELARAREAAGSSPVDAPGTIDRGLDEFERSMRRLACGIPIAQLRATLPGRVASDRRSVLELLELLLGDLAIGAPDWPNRIGSIDYLVTLLCTHGARSAGGVTHDPVGLTPRLAALVARTDETLDVRVEAFEAEFFAAANMNRDELREEFRRRTLRQRKVEMGPLFFASPVLRSIVTYNAALLERVTDEIQDVGDWGILTGADSTGGDSDGPTSVFESKALRRLATAIRGRIRGERATPTPEARLVAALDLDGLEDSEREALGRDTVASAGDPIGTAILVGLLCRQLAVLSIELQELGISPDDVSDLWVEELDRVFEEEIDAKHASDAYKQACALAELRTRFLLAPLAERLREERSFAQRSVRRSRAKESPSARSAPVDASAALATSSPAPLDAVPDALDSQRPDRSAAVSSRPAETSSPTPPTTQAAPAESPATAGAADPVRRRSGAETRRADRAGRGAARAAGAARPRARDLVREALEEDRRSQARTNPPDRSGGLLRPGRIFQAALVLLAVAAGAMIYVSRPASDLHRIAADQLALVSPHLVEGSRNGQGHGPGFVGVVDDAFLALPAEERRSAAESLVERLRERGLEQVMIYDRGRRLRIQAVGSQPVHTL